MTLALVKLELPPHTAMSSETPPRRPELRKDVVTGRWVVFSPARAKRPSDFKSKYPAGSNSGSGKCPFCIGNEHLCAPEIFRVQPDTQSGWKIRVIENLYPALDRKLENPRGSGEVGVLGGFGFHDVVIEAPIHDVNLSDLSPREVGDVFTSYRKRIEQLRAFDDIKYIQVFKNHGASAGASLSHSHSQIIALPVVPPTVSARLDSTKEHFSQTGKCCLCEFQSNDLLIDESTHFISFVPFAATFPFEIWVAPQEHISHFHKIDDEKASELGGLVKRMLLKMKAQLNDPPFNLMIQTSPLHLSSSDSPFAHWFLQIVPQLSGVGGFELGSGCYINPVFPEDAAKIMREIHVPN